MDPLTMAGIGAGVGALGGAFGGGQEHIGTDELLPDWLQGDYKNAAQQISGLNPLEYFQGDTVAGLNPAMQGALDQMQGWGSGMGGTLQNLSALGGGTGMQALGRGYNFMNEMAGMDSPFQYNQGVFDQTMQNLMPSLQGQFDAATRDINRNLNWQQLPGINMAGVGAGHQGSTKVGQQSALAEGMAQDRAADIGAGLYANAVNQAQDAAMDSGRANLGFDQSLIGQYGNYGQLGGNLLNQSQNMGLGNIGLQTGAGEFLQGYDQNVLQGDIDRWNFEQQEPGRHLSQQLGLYGGQMMSGNPYVADPSVLSKAMQGAQAGMGLFTGLSGSGLFGGPSGGYGSSGAQFTPNQMNNIDWNSMPY